MVELEKLEKMEFLDKVKRLEGTVLFLGARVGTQFYPFDTEKLVVPGFPVEEVSWEVYKELISAIYTLEEKAGKPFSKVVEELTDVAKVCKIDRIQADYHLGVHSLTLYLYNKMLMIEVKKYER